MHGAYDFTEMPWLVLAYGTMSTIRYLKSLGDCLNKILSPSNMRHHWQSQNSCDIPAMAIMLAHLTCGSGFPDWLSLPDEQMLPRHSKTAVKNVYIIIIGSIRSKHHRSHYKPGTIPLLL